MLSGCLDSLQFADERLVLVDDRTIDRTREVARLHNARVAERHFDNFASQRDAALDLAHTEWVLFVDADERVPASLREEVLQTIAEPVTATGYWIPRDNYLMGRVVRHAGWFPDYQLRLLKRESVRFDPVRPVHEVPLLEGKAGYLQSPLIHLNYASFREFVRKQERYCVLEADRWLATYGRPRARSLIGQPLREFWRRYVVLEGYREGALGLMLCATLAFYAGKAVVIAQRLDVIRRHS